MSDKASQAPADAARNRAGTYLGVIVVEVVVVTALWFFSRYFSA